MTTIELLNALQAAPSDAERVRIINATTEEERDALAALVAYESMCSHAPLDALLTRLEACVDENAVTALLATTDPETFRALQLELKMAPMNTVKAAQFYMHHWLGINE